MSDLPDRIVRRLRGLAPELDLTEALGARGVVSRIGDGVAVVNGLDNVGYEELVAFDGGALGIALDLGPATTGVVLLTGADSVAAGEGVAGLGRAPSLSVGPDLLGRVVDPLGRPLDGGPPVAGAGRAIFGPALEFIDRTDVNRPLLTGILAVDAAVPIGRGQRELVIGDRNTGKTALALDVVAAQRAGDVACVYVLVGQPMSRVLSLQAELGRVGAGDRTAVIAADASMTSGMQYLAPYAGATVAESFRDAGRDALVIYDDLTKHADAYRQLALLLDRPPGREAFPGDIFYIHAELLERASARRRDLGGGSVTAIPIVETTDSDLSAYIPTNLISITDGQIYLDSARYERNQRPAVDVGRSVSRIGGKAQAEVTRQAARNLRILLSRFEELEALTRVGLEVDASTERTIRRGRVMRELLRQPRFANRRLAEQILTLTAVGSGWLDDRTPELARSVVARAIESMEEDARDVVSALDEGRAPDGDWAGTFKRHIDRAAQIAVDEPLGGGAASP
jgi:F-type H+-transporting ATPase subunit alpha